MKTILLILTVFTLIAAASPLQKNTLETAIEKAEFVGYVMYEQQSRTPGMVWIRATEIFSAQTHRFQAWTSDLSFNPDTEYLLVVSFKYEGGNPIMSRVFYPIKAKNQLSGSELTILNNLPCISEELKRNPSACTRVYEIGADMCGCDKNTYNSVCEMHQHGVLRSIKGPCE